MTWEMVVGGGSKGGENTLWLERGGAVAKRGGASTVRFWVSFEALRILYRRA